MKKSTRLLPIVVGATLLFSTANISTSFAATDRATASTNAYNWLVSVKQTNGLYDSQADGEDVCYTYDQAVAAVAFIAKNDTARAYDLLNKLKGLQHKDGYWYTAYSSKNAVAESEKWIGPILWVVMAAAQYKKATGATSFDAMANDAINWVLKFQQSDGGINGGIDASGKKLTYASTEENEDAYAALKAFGFNSQAEKVRTFLTTKMWDSANNRWYVGRNNKGVFLDVNAWGVQSLGSLGPANYLKSLDYNMNQMRLKKTVNGIVVDGFDFNADKDDVWLEGTAQMAAALYTAGRTTDADYFTDQVIKFQKPNGGIPYSMAGGTTGDDWNMPKVEAISSTGWLILAIHKVNPFKQ
ncbi:hypothetical protein GK047_24295 [Paenibacillus sp. SYP-B3998]|uniref:Squalene cyclase C-terminal domain-containing protein n=1 Tax=Paenibacillus sp. SYP-B3998 TaxID=2678564 RepID=A0A6G4A5J9_9BACL|nr:hypothetical protein [Paenibacillus sp. SYP-B3998]NEW09101.1 hypothetical protein [Paenibacillus sp. SYP-B3998]